MKSKKEIYTLNAKQENFGILLRGLAHWNSRYEEVKDVTAVLIEVNYVHEIIINRGSLVLSENAREREIQGILYANTQTFSPR